MTILTPHLAFNLCESALSYAARLAAFHTGGRLTPFLRDFGIKPMSLVAGEISAIESLNAMSGVDIELLMANAPVLVGKRKYELRGHVVSAEFFARPSVAYCTACLAADDGGHPTVSLVRRHRWFWILDVVRTCPDHGLPLVRLGKEQHDHELIELGARVEERGTDLQQLASSLHTRRVSPLQDYAVGRLSGEAGPHWLDEQGIEQAVRVTQLLGAILVFGGACKPSSLSEDEWEGAGAVGFAYTAKGEAGIRDALHKIHEAFDYAGCKPGPQSVFGPLYTTIATKKARKELGDFKRILREFIFDTFPYPEGTEALGLILPERRVHSAASLADETGHDARKLRNVLITEGLLPQMTAPVIKASTLKPVATSPESCSTWCTLRRCSRF